MTRDQYPDIFLLSPSQVALQPMTSPNVTGGVTMVTQQQQQNLLAGKNQLAGKLQPHLLPKPQLAAQAQLQQQQTRLITPTVTCGSQFVLNTAGNVLTSLPGVQSTSSAPLILGQMVGSTANSNTPFLIQVHVGASKFRNLKAHKPILSCNYAQK